MREPLLILATMLITAVPSTGSANTAPESGGGKKGPASAGGKAKVALPPSGHIFEMPGPVTPRGEIDRILLSKLDEMGVQPALCTDAVFLRRAHMDVIGTLPTLEEARAFLDDPAKGKRARLIDALLEREEFAVYWAMKWGDILRIKAEFPVNLWPNAAQAYDRWVRESIAGNKPYDQFARELLTSSGSNFRVGPVNFYRAIQDQSPEGIASAVALTLMGSRADFWPEDRLAGMAVFFSEVGYKPSREWKEELVFWDPHHSVAWGEYVAAREEHDRLKREAERKRAIVRSGKAAVQQAVESLEKARGATGKSPVPQQRQQNLGAALQQARAKLAEAEAAEKAAVDALAEASTSVDEARAVVEQARQPREPKSAVFPDGSRKTLPLDRDPREVFADWLITPDNPWFTRNIVNRLWSWLLGRGIIHEPDDIREDNPPSNAELLVHLEKAMVASGYDMKKMFRQILNSSTYQFSAIPKSDRPEAMANFASYMPRRLPAEVLIDNVNAITGTTDLYTSAIPEPFTYIPRDMPAIGVADGSITSSFLTLFGRSARATGMESERINEPQSAQMLHMLNSSHIRDKIERGPRLRGLVRSLKTTPEIAEAFYLTILSRYPTEEEVARIVAYGAGKPAKSDAEWADIAWALINSTEALYRH